tara:strand:+ start:431 stop:916 length:486 start_codon:yes stop_codon:yes gene_type:complete
MRFLSSDYTGRTSDIDIFGLSDSSELMDASLAFSPGAVVGGSYKEAQKFLRVLLSDRSNLLGQTDYGTDFYKRLTQGVILSEAQFRVYFSAAKARAIAFLQAAKLTESGVRDTRFTDDEIITEVDITRLVVGLDKVTATFKFTFLDNEADIIVPVGIPVGA